MPLFLAHVPAHRLIAGVLAHQPAHLVQELIQLARLARSRPRRVEDALAGNLLLGVEAHLRFAGRRQLQALDGDRPPRQRLLDPVAEGISHPRRIDGRLHAPGQAAEDAHDVVKLALPLLASPLVQVDQRPHVAVAAQHRDGGVIGAPRPARVVARQVDPHGKRGGGGPGSLAGARGHTREELLLFARQRAEEVEFKEEAEAMHPFQAILRPEGDRIAPELARLLLHEPPIFRNVRDHSFIAILEALARERAVLDRLDHIVELAVDPVGRADEHLRGAGGRAHRRDLLIDHRAVEILGLVIEDQVPGVAFLLGVLLARVRADHRAAFAPRERSVRLLRGKELDEILPVHLRFGHEEHSQRQAERERWIRLPWLAAARPAAGRTRQLRHHPPVVAFHPTHPDIHRLREGRRVEPDLNARQAKEHPERQTGKQLVLPGLASHEDGDRAPLATQH